MGQWKGRQILPAGTAIIAIADGLRSDHTLRDPMDVSDASTICNLQTGEEMVGWAGYLYVERDGEWLVFLSQDVRWGS